MPNSDSKTYIVNDQPTEKDALDFTPRKAVETLADIIQTGNTPLTIGVFGTWGNQCQLCHRIDLLIASLASLSTASRISLAEMN